jgi:hypothetical protein
MTTKLEDHIDTPIKKCVAGFALLKFQTIFSCCGFTYRDESVPKTHLPLKSYLYISTRDLHREQRSMLFDIAMGSGWVISPIAGGEMVDFHFRGWEQNHPWAAANSPHKAELNVMGLKQLEDVLDSFIFGFEKTHPTIFINPITIIDGNKLYKDGKGLKHWQYPVCDDWEITLDIYKQL